LAVSEQPPNIASEMMVKSEESLTTVNEEVLWQKELIFLKEGMKYYQVYVLWTVMIEV
jgi:hypothetical protein